jgi:hypothetical protein
MTLHASDRLQMDLSALIGPAQHSSLLAVAEV